MRTSFGQVWGGFGLALLFASGLPGCGASGSTGGAGGSVGTGGAAPGSGGSAGGGGMASAGGASGSAPADAAADLGATGGTTSGSGGSSGIDSGAPESNASGSGGAGALLHGGTSGAYICPAAANYAGMVPALSGAFALSTGAATNNGEGPVWVAPLNALIFSSKLGTSETVRQLWKLAPPNPAQVSVKTMVGSNGLTLDNDNKIIAADHQLSAIVRLDPVTGAVLDTIVDQYMGAYFQSPNDVIVRGDGNIYFSDPWYFNTQGKTPKTAATAFYRISPAKEVSVIEATGTKDPNGVALSPDDNTLYTLVTVDQQVKKWALNPDGSINGAGANFVKTAFLPDGMCVDCAGNLYVGTMAGLQVFSPAGKIITTIGNAKAINCSFGGPDHKTLFVTSDDHVRYGAVNIPGLP